MLEAGNLEILGAYSGKTVGKSHVWELERQTACFLCLYILHMLVVIGSIQQGLGRKR